MGQVIDVDSTRCNIGRNNQIHHCASRFFHDAVALDLRHPAVQSFNSISTTDKSISEFVDFDTRATENQSKLWRFQIENAPKRCDLVRSRNDVCSLAHFRHRAFRAFVARNQNARRIFEMSFRNGSDARRKRGGKKRSLSHLGSCFHNEFEIFCKSHIEHFVCFIKHECLQAAQVKRLSAQMIQRTTRSCDDNVCATIERNNLSAKFLAAINWNDRSSKTFAVFVKRFGDLHRKFARGHQDQRERLICNGLRSTNTLQDWQRECRSFPCTSRRLTKQISAFHQRCDRRFLNWCWLFISKSGQLREQFFPHTEICECFLHRRRLPFMAKSISMSYLIEIVKQITKSATLKT